MAGEEIKAQPGPQTVFLSTSADIAIYGGAAGGGKTFGLLIEPLRHVTTNRLFSALFLRRTTPQILNPGGLWDAASNLYPRTGAVPKVGLQEWHWPRGGKVKMSHLEHEISKLNFQGAEIPLICFDELTHFTESQFWYLVSRNRSMSGVRGYVRATCNPDPDSFVATLIAWWIDQETGFPIPERAGKIRWVLRINDTLHWGNTRQELIEQFRGKVPNEALQPKSVTFIPASLNDNAKLMAADPGYYANLLALPTVERERLLGGNWKIRASAGLYFQRRWLKIAAALPADIRLVRSWDLAGTEKTETNDPDFTETLLIGEHEKRFFLIEHAYMRGSPQAVQRFVRNTADQDKAAGRSVTISVPQDPGQAGKAQVATYSELLLGHTVRFSVESRAAQSTSSAPSTKAAKVSRFNPFSAQCEAGNVSYVVAPWNKDFFERLEAFPTAVHDDTADVCSRGFHQLIASPAPARIISFPLIGR